MPRRASGTPELKQPSIPEVAVAAPRYDYALFPHCTASWAAWKLNSDLMKLVPATMTIDIDLKALGDAISNAPGGGPTETAAVKAAAKDVRADWDLLAKYLTLYIRNGKIVNAATLATSVLMRLSNVGKRKPKPPLAVKPQTSGTALAVILAVAKAVLYQVDWSSDQQTWSSATSHKSRVPITGLTAGKRYYFRVKAFLTNDTWTDVIATVNLVIP